MIRVGNLTLKHLIVLDMNKCLFCNQDLIIEDKLGYRFCRAELYDDGHYLFEDEGYVILKIRSEDNRIVVVVSNNDPINNTSVYINDVMCERSPAKYFSYSMTTEEAFKLIKLVDKIPMIL